MALSDWSTLKIVSHSADVQAITASSATKSAWSSSTRSQIAGAITTQFGSGSATVVGGIGADVYSVVTRHAGKRRPGSSWATGPKSKSPQRATGYGRRSLAETAIGRYKHLIGPKLRARTRSGQSGEVALSVQALNRMIRVAKPISVRVG